MKIKNGILFLLFLFVSIFANADSKVDSLINVVNSTNNDIDKVNTLNILGWEYLYSDIEKSKSYEEQALELSKSIGYKTGEAVSITHLGYLNVLSGKYNDALSKFNQSIEIFESIKDSAKLATSYTNIANIYFYLSNYSNNIDFNNKALKIHEQLKDSFGIANTYTSLGNAYLKLGDYPNAHKYFINSLEIYEKNKVEKLYAGCYNNIAIVYKRQKDIENALKNYKKSIEYSQKYNQLKNSGETYNNIGVIYMESNKNNEADSCFQKSLDIFNTINYKNGIATVTSNLGDVFANKFEFEKALEQYNLSLKIKEEINDTEGEVSTLNSIAEVYLKSLKLELAKKTVFSSLEKSKKIKSLNQINISYDLLSKIYEQENNYLKAFEYKNLFIATTDSLLNIEKTKEIETLKMRYDVDKKEAEIVSLSQKNLILENENKINELTINQNKIIIISVSIVLILIITLSFLLINRQRIKIKKDKQLHEAKKALMDVEMKNITLEKDKLNTELSYRKKEVANLATQIIEKNNLITSIEDNLKEMKISNTESSLKNITFDLNMSKSREDFYVQVEELHKDFFFKLSQKFPDLTKNENKLAALLRMELSSKDIATLMNISSKSVDMNRYRLRKKLNLDTEIDLTEFLKSI